MNSKATVINTDEAFILSTLHAMWKSRCLGLIVGLKIPELLCSCKEPSLSIEDIAKKSGCRSSKGLYPIMRMLTQWGIGKELKNKHFAKNRGIELLRRDKGPSLGHLIEYHCSEEQFSAIKSLAACVKEDQPGFVIQHGMNHFEYMNDIEKRPYDKTKMCKGSSEYTIGSNERRREFAENYSETLAYVTYLTTLPNVPGINNVYEAFPWSTCQKLLDMGGSSGYFLASILKLPNCEHIQGHVVDLQDVIDDALKNVHHLGIPEHRIEFTKHDFTKPFPRDHQLQVDTVVFKMVLSMFILDHNLMAKILLNCRSLFPSKGGRLLIIEFSSPDAGDTESKVGINGFELGVLSVHWLSICGNPLLTRSEWIQNLQEIGFKTGYEFKQVYDTFSGGMTIFELSCNSV